MASKLIQSMKTLGIDQNTPHAEAKRKYKKLINLWHPDRYFNESEDVQDNATNTMKKIVAAWCEYENT